MKSSYNIEINLPDSSGWSDVSGFQTYVLQLFTAAFNFRFISNSLSGEDCTPQFDIASTKRISIWMTRNWKQPMCFIYR